LKQKEQYLVVITSNTTEFLEFELFSLVLVLNSLELFMYKDYLKKILEEEVASTEIQTLILLYVTCINVQCS